MSKQFHEWVAAYGDDVWSLARYLLGNESDAEDVTQDTFIKLWGRGAAIEEDHVKPWLLRVARNACLDRLRRLRLVPEHDSTEPADPADTAEISELGLHLRAAISKLEEPFRSLVLLREMHQLSYAELADVTDLSLDQVRTYLHRGRRALRAMLEDVGS